MYRSKTMRVLSVVTALMLSLMLLACSGEEDTEGEEQNGTEQPAAGAAPTATSVPQAPLPSPTPYGIAPPSPIVVTVPSATQEPSDTPVPATSGSSASTPTAGSITIASASPTTGNTQQDKPATTNTQQDKTPVGDEKQDEQPALSGDAPITHYQMPEPEGGWTPSDQLNAIRVINKGGYYPDGTVIYGKSIDEGSIFYVYEGNAQNRAEICGPDIGIAFDSTNRTWSDKSHLIAIWREDNRHCLVGTKYQLWKDRERHPLSDNGSFTLQDHERRERFAQWGQPLDFRTDNSDADYTLRPPDINSEIHWGSLIELDDGTVSTCDRTMAPWAVWSRFEGFVPLLGDDQNVLEKALNVTPEAEGWHPDLPFEAYDERVEIREKLRQAGIYFIIDDVTQDRGFAFSNFCWKVENLDDMPPAKPCIWCHLTITKRSKAFEER